MPYDWFFEVESILIRLVPAYTLEMIDECDIYRLLPYYFWDYRKALRAKKDMGQADTVVVRNGKKYKKITADQAGWLDKIF